MIEAVRVNGLSVAYRRAGHAPPLVLVPAPETTAAFGSLKSTRAGYANYLAAVIEALALGRTHVAGPLARAA